MKKWMLALAALIWFTPVKGTDVGKLLPVELVSLRREGETLRMETDTGDFGMGDTLEEAMEDLKRTAQGQIFLETADYLLLSPDSQSVWPELLGYFRPGTLAYQTVNAVDPEEAAQYLRTRRAGIPLNRMEEAGPLPVIKEEEGRVELAE